MRYRAKPMNCPMHCLIYRSQQRSYRDLPLRLSEVANVYRNERSGVLHGLLRVRGLCMDDAHIFCTMDQIEDEIFLCLDQVDRLVRQTFGFELDFEVSTRPPERLGDDATWERAEQTLQSALEPEGNQLPDRRGRRRVLRTEDRHQVPRRDRPALAGAHDSARLPAARALRAGIHRGRQPCAPAGDDPSRHLRHDGAVHRQSHRAFRGGVSRSGWRRNRSG